MKLLLSMLLFWSVSGFADEKPTYLCHVEVPTAYDSSRNTVESHSISNALVVLNGSSVDLTLDDKTLSISLVETERSQWPVEGRYSLLTLLYASESPTNESIEASYSYGMSELTETVATAYNLKLDDKMARGSLHCTLIN